MDAVRSSAVDRAENSAIDYKVSPNARYPRALRAERNDHRNRVACSSLAIVAASSPDAITAQRAGSTVAEVKGSHAIYVSKPEAVAALIEKAAKGVKLAVN